MNTGAPKSMAAKLLGLTDTPHAWLREIQERRAQIVRDHWIESERTARDMTCSRLVDEPVHFANQW